MSIVDIETEKTEVKETQITPRTGVVEDAPYDAEEHNEVFQKSTDGVDFRTLGWPMASVIFLKRTFNL